MTAMKMGTLQYHNLSKRGHCHLISLPYFPTTYVEYEVSSVGLYMKFGGTAQATAKANEESWKEVLQLLSETL